jgi:hypothetical protein
VSEVSQNCCGRGMKKTMIAVRVVDPGMQARVSGDACKKPKAVDESSSYEEER